MDERNTSETGLRPKRSMPEEQPASEDLAHIDGSHWHFPLVGSEVVDGEEPSVLPDAYRDHEE